MAKNSKKLREELEKLKRFKSVSDIIQRSEAENALLYSSSRGDQDPADDELFETMMAKLVSKGSAPSERKELEYVEKSSTVEKGERIEKRKRVSLTRKGGKPKISQHIHAVKSKAKQQSRKAKTGRGRSAGKGKKRK